MLPILIIAVIVDCATYKISNIIIFSGMLIGLITNICSLGAKGILEFLIGFLVPILVLIIVYAFGAIGAGDVKLFGVIGGLIGVSAAFNCVIYSFFIGGVIGLAKIIINKSFIMCFKNLVLSISTIMYSHKFSKYNKQENSTIHFSIPILLGVILYAIVGGIY